MYTLHHGDCLDILPTLAAQSVDAVICDPPYGTTACKWDSVIPFAPMWAEIKRVLKPRGACVLFGSQPFTSALVMSNPKWFRYEWIWEKSTPTGFLDAQKKPLKAHEQIIVFGDQIPKYNPVLSENHAPMNKQGKSRRSNPEVYREGITNRGNDQRTWRYPKTVQRFNCINSGHIRLHPTQKPLALLEYLVKTYTDPGDTVLDFTMGSGTTGHACVNLDRRFIGIERDAAYFAIAQQRLADAASAPRQLGMEDAA